MMLVRNENKSTGSFIAVILLLLLVGAVSLSVLFSRLMVYSSAEFKNVHSLTETAQPNPNSVSDSSVSSNGQTSSSAQNTQKHSEFHMEAEESIFKFSYDETGKITVEGAQGNDDRLIAPGTSNVYQFTLQNPGDTPLDYTMTMEAYVTGTELSIPVNVRVWDYTNKYLLGSSDNKVDVLELNTVQESAELGAGRYAVYNLEWEWPFERDDDEYDTLLGNLAVDGDLELHIKINTVAEYDENPNNPNSGLVKPPQTGDDSQLVLLCLLCAGSFIGLCVMVYAVIKSARKEKYAEQNK